MNQQFQQQQQFQSPNAYHTASYRGNQPGHDQYLRSDSQQPSQMGRMGQSQFQPAGIVQSSYQPQQQFQQQPFQQQQQFQSPNAYHTASYRGNQPGHDQYLRSDSQQPSQMGRMGQSQFQPAGFVRSSYQPQQQFQQQPFQQQQQFQSPNAYHTASYRGDQPGHDQYLRSDSQQPSQMGRMGQNSFSQTSPQQFQQAANPNAYHTASYRGNQPGHDQYLRSDSQQPSQMGRMGQISQTQSAGIQPQQQFQQSSNAYHTASYRGNQPGHDQYLRSDSNQPNQR